MEIRILRYVLLMLAIMVAPLISRAQLKVVSPNGGETFAVGSTVTIRWSGVTFGQVVTLEYSTDNGTSWNTITTTASGLQYLWSNIPNTVSNSCLLRVSYNLASPSVLYLLGSGTLNAEFSPDGNEVIGSGIDGYAYIWDSHSAQVLNKFQTQIASAVPTSSTLNTWATFSHDAKTFATVSPMKDAQPDSTPPYVHNVLRLFDAASGAKLREWTIPHEKIGDYVTGMCRFSPDGTMIAATGNDSVTVFSTVTGNKISRSKGFCYYGSIYSGCNQPYFVDWSADGTRILAGGTTNDDSVPKFIASDPITGNALMSYKYHTVVPNFNLYAAAKYSPNMQQFVSVGQDSVMRIWDAASGKILYAVQPNATYPLWAEYSHDGKHILSLGYDSIGSKAFSLKLWNSSDESYAGLVGTIGGATRSASFNFDDSRIVLSVPTGAAIFQSPTSSTVSAVSAATWSIVPSSGANVVVRMTSLSGKVNDLILAPVLIDNPSGAVAAGAKTITVSLQFDATMLAPVGPTPQGSIIGNTREIPLTLSINPNDTVLTTLQFQVALGDDSVTLMRFVGVASDNAKVIASEQEGLFTLLNICYQGGPRLLNPNDSTAFTLIAPNPASNRITVNLNLAETGTTRLWLANSLGQNVLTLLDGNATAGKQQFTFDASVIASGSYFLVLQTPTEHKIQQVEVLR